MPEILETTVDKFTFKVRCDRLYVPEGLWALWLQPTDPARVRVGLTDYLQQSSGDLAFAEASPVGTPVKAGNDIGSVETIKVNLSLPSPVDGVVVEVNPALEMAPEAVNRDPYGEGWLVVVEVTGSEAQRARLMDPAAYLAHMKRLVEEEVRGR